MWCHSPSRAATCWISLTGSTLVTDVVPTVDTTQNGVLPAARSSRTACSSRSGRIRYCASTPILRTFFVPIPSAMHAFSTEECACCDVYTVIPGRAPPSRSAGSAAARAAPIACSVEIDAVSWIIPKNASGRPSHCLSHPITASSSSTAAGHDAHNIPFTFSTALSNSPTIPGPDALTEKYPWNRGWFQWFTAGSTVRWKSSRIASTGSPSGGACSGIRSFSSPGRTAGITGYSRIPSRYCAAHSSAAAPCSLN